MYCTVYAQIWLYLSNRRTKTSSSAFVNKSRYSTSPKQVDTPIIDITLFNESLPVTLTPEMTHLKLAQSFAKTYKTPIKIYDFYWCFMTIMY